MQGSMGSLIEWDAGTGKIVKSHPRSFGMERRAERTDGGIACYGTLEGYLKCVDATDVNKELYKFKDAVRHHR